MVEIVKLDFNKQVMVVYTSHTRPLKAETGRLWVWGQPKLHSQTVSFKNRNVTSKVTTSRYVSGLANTKYRAWLYFRKTVFLFLPSFLTNRKPSLIFSHLPLSEQVIKSRKDSPAFLETGHGAHTRGALPVLREKNIHLQRWERHRSCCVP